MDRFEYCDILANNLATSASEMGLESFIFQQDNDPKHTSKHLKEFFKEKKIEVLPWPSQSPDLNPIEHLWAFMKQRLRGKIFKKKEELKEEILSIWKEITPNFCKKLSGSMPKRVIEVIKSGGWSTSY
jgi:DDE superfamily endonuclease